MRVLVAFDPASDVNKALKKAYSAIKGTDGSLTLLYVEPRSGTTSESLPTIVGSTQLSANKAFEEVEGTGIRDMPAVRGTRVARAKLKELGVKSVSITRRSMNPVGTVQRLVEKGGFDAVFVAKGFGGSSSSVIKQTISKPGVNVDVV